MRRLHAHVPRASTVGITSLLRGRWLRAAAVAFVSMIVSGVLVGSLAWLYFAHAQHLSAVRYVDVFTPNGWRRIKTAIGDRAIGDASVALKSRDIDTALRLYRIGLAKSPRNSEGRIALARLYVTLRRPDLARDLLLSGLPALAENPTYLQFTLGFLLEFQFDSELRSLADRLLNHHSADVRRQAAYHASAVAFHRGDFDRAETLLLAHRLAHAPEGSLLLARADLERGAPELALARLTPALASQTTQTAALALALQIQERLGRTSDFARMLALRLADNPLSPTPRLELLQQLHTHHRVPEVARETESYLQLFAHDQSALLGLADFAARTGQPTLVRRVQQIFARHSWNVDAPALLHAEACLAAGRFAEGLEELERHAKENPAPATPLGPAFDGLRTVALFALNRDDEARLQLEHLLVQPNLRAENLSAVATRLLALGRAPAAQLVLDRAVTLDPRNQSALTALVRLEAEQHQLDSLAVHVPQLLATRRPSRDALAFVYRRVGSDLNLLHPAQAALLAELRPHLGPDAERTAPGQL